MQGFIEIDGARENNLKNVSLRLPRYSFTVITGVSGSGKSSLAYDTLYKEGQWRFIASLSPYARQFLGEIEKPKVDRIDGISPTVSIDQKRGGHSSRSTVGTITAIYDYLRLLFARLGTPYCPNCNVPVTKQSPDQIAQVVLQKYDRRHIYILVPMVVERKGEYRKELAEWQRDGFVRVRVDGSIRELDGAIALSRYEKHTLELVLDRLEVTSGARSRIREGIEHATRLGQGLVAVATTDDHYELFSVHRACPHCGFSIPELEPRQFSFNNPQGACPACDGKGILEEFEPTLLVPDPSLSLVDGALACLNKDGNILFSHDGIEDITRLALASGVSVEAPWQSLPQEFQQAVLYGTASAPITTTVQNSRRHRKNGSFRGVIPILQELYRKWNLAPLRRFFRISPCAACGGTRLRRESLSVLFRGYNIAQMTQMDTGTLYRTIDGIVLSSREEIIGRDIFHELKYRLSFLSGLGLAYLTMERQGSTLAGGEMQRIRLARQLGTGLQGVLYILDEPSIGLHPRDNDQLLTAISRLRDMGNTLVVIEHDEETMRKADYVVDIGPGAGESGGTIVAAGSLAQIVASDQSLTGQFLSGKKEIPMPRERRTAQEARLTVVGARAFNLKNIRVDIPLGLFVVVSGVSGSGKSTLVSEVVYKALARHLYKNSDIPGAHDAILGLELIDKVVEVDQSPIGRTPRSNPATYIQVFDEIRRVFSLLPEARVRGYAPGRFSFNVAGGRCEQCDGHGYKEVEMQFLPSIWIPCEECQGKRFNRETLEIVYNGKNIADILDMTVAEACAFFTNHPKIKSILEMMLKVGMGYIKLGQPSPTLSGGEAQRIKLVRELHGRSTGKTLYLLDEPTTGLHFADVEHLLYALNNLVEQGNTVVVIEHNLEIIKVADWIIDMGPEGGAQGGEVVVAGPPEVVMACPRSYTGQALQQYLTRNKTTVAAATTTAIAKADVSSGGRDIVIHGATKHNLKNVTVSFPWQKMSVVTGVSGSGKSSLVFDTLFAEGQRTFLESLSTYARRFLGRLDQGEVDATEGLAPVISIDQKTASVNPRSTVATMTEIYDYLRILYARIGIAHCPDCGNRLESYTPSAAATKIFQDCHQATGLILAPLYMPGARNKTFLLSGHTKLVGAVQALKNDGFTRVLIGGNLYRLDELPASIPRKPIHLVIDRITVDASTVSRLAEGMETAFTRGHGVAFFHVDGGKPMYFSDIPACVLCDYYQTQELHPRMFSFNHYMGACTRCDGLGFERRTDEEEPCRDCQGERLQRPYLAVTIGGLSIAAFCRQTATQARQFLQKLQLNARETQIASDAIRDILNRLRFLEDVGLQYLTLERRGHTLSGGEAQRIRLATQIGNRLVGVIYVLDEPTIGLHPADTARLLKTLRDLVELGNTVVMVEHDPQCIRAADYVIDMGPGAGHAGGEVVACGTAAQLAKNPQSLTGKYLSGELSISIPRSARVATDYLTVHQATLHNLKNIDVAFPLQQFTVVTGVSGSGKSTLVVTILQDALLRHFADNKGHDICDGSATAGFARITGASALERVVVVEQTAIGRSSHSNIATVCEIFTPIRELFASLPGAKARGFTPSRFSFNRPGGRCEVCEGMGVIEVEMHFLSDVWVTCEACQGRRYLEETLEVHYHDKNIAEVLEMDVSQSRELFAAQPSIRKKLDILADIGLGYIKLGQATSTLSGGEAQRLKLAKELIATSPLPTLYIMDEPTTGLHPADVQRLLEVISKLIRQGHTVIVIEHNLDVIRWADWVIDLGPEGGDRGGEVVCVGTPQQIMVCTQSHTGQSLGGRGRVVVLPERQPKCKIRNGT